MNPEQKTPENQAKFLAQSDLEEIWPTQNRVLLQELHLMTRDGKLNQDARRKLKQIYHFLRLLLPVLKSISSRHEEVEANRTSGALEAASRDPLIVDVGAGKGYLGFLLYDLWLKPTGQGHLSNIEIRPELVSKARELSRSMDFSRMDFIQSTIGAATEKLKSKPALVTALHACDTATDEAIALGIQSGAHAIAVVPCCQAEVARLLSKVKLESPGLWQLWRHPMHAREFGSHLTNVIRGLVMEAAGYQVTVTELSGWEHSLKNELILGVKPSRETPETKKAVDTAKTRLTTLLKDFPITPYLVRELG